MSLLLARLAKGDTLVSDGAMGTLLLEAGLERGACPDALSLTDAAALTRIAATYRQAGADLVHTNTFGASPLKLAEYGLEGRTEEINARAVDAARAGLERVERDGAPGFVSASMGPSGRILEPYGDTPEGALFDAFRRQAAAVARAGVDAITVETMTDLREAALAIEAIRSVDGTVPVLATMTFQSTPRGFFTVMGVGVEEAVEGLLTAGAQAVGSNCGSGIAVMVEVARAFAAATDAPLLIQANAGAPEVRGGSVCYPETPEVFAAAVPGLLEAGVSILGGCCGSDPAHIRALRGAVDARH